jgi:hypothetical protein
MEATTLGTGAPLPPGVPALQAVVRELRSVLKTKPDAAPGPVRSAGRTPHPAATETHHRAGMPTAAHCPSTSNTAVVRNLSEAVR